MPPPTICTTFDKLEMRIGEFWVLPEGSPIWSKEFCPHAAIVPFSYQNRNYLNRKKKHKLPNKHKEW